MNKKLWIIISVSLIPLIIFVFLTIKKGNGPLQIKADKFRSLPNLLSQIKEVEAKQNFLAAKELYLKLINEFSNSAEVMLWQKKIEDINIKLLFSSTVTTASMLYEIKPGDTLTKIAKEFVTTTDLIMKSNNLANDKILPGRKIKVWRAPFNIFIDKSQNTLLLKTNEEIIKTYVVSTGKDNSTPLGNFKIVNKLINPTWFKAGAVVAAGSPENILGTRWLGFNLLGYGIHGTVEPKTLGKQVTQGCVRMSNPDIEELFTVIPVGTEVTIVD